MNNNTSILAATTNTTNANSVGKYITCMAKPRPLPVGSVFTETTSTNNSNNLVFKNE